MGEAIIPIGKTRRQRTPRILLTTLGLPGISEERWEIYLGAPIASDKQVYKDFLHEKYMKMKKKISGWKGLSAMTQVGRTMIANSMIYSMLRYWAQFLTIPGKIMDALDSDAQALVWNKSVAFTEGELGTEKVNRRFMRQGTEHNPRQHLGLGLLSWKDHVDAIQAKAWLNYLDGSRGAWKEVLDQWVLKSYAPYGRGAILMKDPDKRKKMKVGSAPLPHFWAKALEVPALSLILECVDNTLYACRCVREQS